MDAEIEKSAVTLTIMIFLLSYIVANMEVGYSNNTYGEIDLFTQKEPYSGKGPNMPSDALSPEDVVILYASVTYNEEPLQNSLVAFYVQIPDNTSFSLTTRTNTSGIATTNFAIPQKRVSESEVFGEWLVLANVLIDGEVYQDTLTFEVDWIVKLISVRTNDENLTYRTSFGIGGDVGLEITLRSVAMSIKSTTLAIVIQDELNVPVNYSLICDFEVQPNEKIVFLYYKLYIPKWARVGSATIFVSAFTTLISEGGVPYCPEISTSFFITLHEPLVVDFHDVAVLNVVPSTTLVELGQPLSISVVVRNEGTEVERFNVSAYCDVVLIGTIDVTALLPYSKVTLNFALNTSLLNAGNYTITISIPKLVNEADTTDNFFVDGVVEIKPKLPEIIHNIAIVDIKISNHSLFIGELLQINVSVFNKGTETETFNVGSYYDSSLIENLQVCNLAPNTQVRLTFVWNTSCVHEGFYQISAFAPLSSDINTSDNTSVDGTVQVKAKPPELIIHDVAVSTVSPYSNFTYVGEVLEIFVIVKNHGNATESFNVTAFYDKHTIETLLVENLELKSQKTLVFQWNTKNVTEGNYTLSARASKVLGEENLENNSYQDGIVTVVKAPMGWFVPYWFYWLLLFLLIPIIILLIAWYYSRKRRKRAEEAFSSGWTAWYYGRDMRKRTSKT